VTRLEAGTTFAGKYLIDSVLGKGGMGAVYLATNQAIGRRVAIKVLVADLSDREDVKKRFELEARAAAVINHPGIVDVLDMGETGEGEPFIVMEYLEGATLKAVFKKYGIFSPAEAVGVIAPLLEALAAAHQAQVIHRDIKPANVFLCTRPKRLVKLLDFGISRFGQSTGLTHTGTAVGTPKYMAPEQVLGERTLGPAADLYSVGAVLYELLGGRAPYDADSDIATLAKLLKEEHEPLATVRPDLPMKLCAFVDGLLVKDAERRPKDAAKVKEQLLALAKPSDLSALYELAQEVGSRSNTGGTPRPPSGPAKLPVTPSPPPSVGDEAPGAASGRDGRRGAAAPPSLRGPSAEAPHRLDALGHRPRARRRSSGPATAVARARHRGRRGRGRRAGGRRPLRRARQEPRGRATASRHAPAPGGGDARPRAGRERGGEAVSRARQRPLRGGRREDGRQPARADAGERYGGRGHRLGAGPRAEVAPPHLLRDSRRAPGVDAAGAGQRARP
jgi:serine/threonine-protein kinase